MSSLHASSPRDRMSRRNVSGGTCGTTGARKGGSSKGPICVRPSLLCLLCMPALVFVIEFPVMDTKHQPLRRNSDLLCPIAERCAFLRSDPFLETIGELPQRLGTLRRRRVEFSLRLDRG